MVAFNLAEKLNTESDMELTETLNRLLKLAINEVEHDWAMMMGPKGIEGLSRWALGITPIAPKTRHLALQCLSHVLSWSQEAKQLFLDGGFVQPLVMLLQSDFAREEDRAYSMCLLVIFCTDSDLNLSPYIEHGSFARVVNERIAYVANLGYIPYKESSLGLITAIGRTGQCTGQMYRFSDSWPYLLDMFMDAPILSAPLMQSMKQLTSCMSFIPADEPFPSPVVEKLLVILEIELTADKKASRELQLAVEPLVTLLEAAAIHPEARPALFARLMPSDEDRSLPVGRGTTLPHVLVKHAASNRVDVPMRSMAKVISHLLYLLSDEDASKLVTNVGLGNGAVMFRMMGIELDILDAGLERVQNLRIDIEGHTGQLVSTMDFPLGRGNMSQEEDEYVRDRLSCWLDFARAYGQMQGVDYRHPAWAKHCKKLREERDTSLDRPTSIGPFLPSTYRKRH